jgi:hypothetical protein
MSYGKNCNYKYLFHFTESIFRILAFLKKE